MDMINLNESVKVKLTDFGISLYKLRYDNDPEKMNKVIHLFNYGL